MSNKIVIAKPGFNALKETNPDNLIFSSDYNTLKYDISGHYQMNVGVLGVFTETVQIIPHNLGYMPFFIVYCNDFGHHPANYSLTEYFDTTGRFRAARAHVDATNLYLTLGLDAGAAATCEWYYKIFKNNLGF